MIAQSQAEMDAAFDLSGQQFEGGNPAAFGSGDIPGRGYKAYSDAMDSVGWGKLSREEWNVSTEPGGGARFLTPEQQEVLRARDANK